jgi:hypothetical protein
MIDHDRIFKELIRTFFLEFIALFFPGLYADLDPDSLEFLDKEVFTDVTEGEKHEADLIVKVRLRGQTAYFLIHIEAQSEWRGEFPRRMFTYFARLHEGYQVPVFPIVVMTADSPLYAVPSEYVVSVAGWTVLQFNYRVVQLNRLSWRDFIRHENPLANALMAKMQMTEAERKQVKVECLRLILTQQLDPARMQMLAGFVDTYLKLPPQDEQWFETEVAKFEPTEKEKAMYLMTTWERLGMEKGMEKGLEQGATQEAQKMVLRQLTGRFGAPVVAAAEPRIRQLPLTQLEDLGDALIFFNQPAELTNWLEQAEAQAISLQN